MESGFRFLLATDGIIIDPLTSRVVRAPAAIGTAVLDLR